MRPLSTHKLGWSVRDEAQDGQSEVKEGFKAKEDSEGKEGSAVPKPAPSQGRSSSNEKGAPRTSLPAADTRPRSLWKTVQGSIKKPAVPKLSEVGLQMPSLTST